eukprot:3114900-Rhodomonas_salina.1
METAGVIAFRAWVEGVMFSSGRVQDLCGAGNWSLGFLEFPDCSQMPQSERCLDRGCGFACLISQRRASRPGAMQARESEGRRPSLATMRAHTPERSGASRVRSR